MHYATDGRRVQVWRIIFQGRGIKVWKNISER